MAEEKLIDQIGGEDAKPAACIVYVHQDISDDGFASGVAVFGLLVRHLLKIIDWHANWPPL